MDASPTAPPPVTRHWWRHALFVGPLANSVMGIAILASGLIQQGLPGLITGPSIVLVIVGVLTQRLAPEMYLGRLSVRGSTTSVPLVLAACMMAPQKAALVGLVIALAQRRSHLNPNIGQHLAMALGRAGGVAAISWVVHAIDPSTNDTAQLMLVGALAALLLQASRLVNSTIMVELRHPGEGRRYVHGMGRLMLLDTVLPVLGLSVVLNFAPRPVPIDALSIFGGNFRPDGAGNPLPIVLAVVLFQVGCLLIMRVMLAERSQRTRSEHLRETFSRYVPQSLIDQLDRAGAQVELGGEEREISVLFCDIRGFTSWSEHLPPGQVVEELNELLSELSHRVFEGDGSLDKFTGDGLMAFWGAPLDQPDHARRAFLAALAMVEGLEVFNAERAEQGKPPFGLGVGVHTGTAIVGNVGHVDRHDYTAIGDTVNLSARIEAATKDVGEQLLVSSATMDALPEHLRGMCAERGTVHVKGREAPVRVWTVDEHEALGVASGSFGLPELDGDDDADVVEVGAPVAG